MNEYRAIARRMYSDLRSGMQYLGTDIDVGEAALVDVLTDFVQLTHMRYRSVYDEYDYAD